MALHRLLTPGEARHLPSEKIPGPACQRGTLSPRQQAIARAIRNGPAGQRKTGTAVSRIAPDFDETMRHRRGRLSLEEFAAIIGRVPLTGPPA